MKSKLLNAILNIVCEVCEVSKEDVVSMRKSEYIVEARSIFVSVCRQYGLPSGSIARFLNRKRIQAVSEMLGNYRIFSKQSYSFRLMSKEVDEKISAIYPRS